MSRKGLTKNASKSDSLAIFERLSRRGIRYVEIKKIVSLDLPHATLFFERQFGAHTARQVLRQIERWKRLLKGDFILSAAQKREIQKTIGGIEMFAWNALIEASFPKLGPWQMSRRFLPNRHDPELRYIDPDLQIVAIHEETRQKRTALIPGGYSGIADWGNAWRTAFADLGLLGLVLKQESRKRLVVARRPQAWPIFTIGVIPRLYEFLAPFYRKRGHVWSGKENVLTRDAFFPQDLPTLSLAQVEKLPTADAVHVVVERHHGLSEDLTEDVFALSNIVHVVARHADGTIFADTITRNLRTCGRLDWQANSMSASGRPAAAS